MRHRLRFQRDTIDCDSLTFRSKLTRSTVNHRRSMNVFGHARATAVRKFPSEMNDDDNDELVSFTLQCIVARLTVNVNDGILFWGNSDERNELSLIRVITCSSCSQETTSNSMEIAKFPVFVAEKSFPAFKSSHPASVGLVNVQLSALAYVIFITQQHVDT